METNQFIKATVGVVVVFLVIIAVAIPIIGGFTESSPGETGENSDMSGANRSLYSIEDAAAIVLTLGNPTTMKINDDTIELENDGGISSIFTDEMSVGYTPNNDLLFIQDNVFDSFSGTATINFDGSHLSITYDDTTKEFDPDYLYVIIPKQTSKPIWAGEIDYVQISTNNGESTVNAYVNAASTIVASATGSPVPFVGTYDDVKQVVLPFPMEQNYAFNYEDLGTYIKLNSYTINGEAGSQYYTFVPTTYYMELPVEPQVSGPVADMVNLVPLLLIVGLIIAAVAAFITLKSRGGGA